MSSSEVDERYRTRLFFNTWLPQVVDESELRTLRRMSVPLVREMFPDVWALGPQGSLWHSRVPKLVTVFDACLDGRLSMGEVLLFQHAFHDIFWVHRWHRQTLTAFSNRYRKQGLPMSSEFFLDLWKHRFWFDKGMRVLTTTDAYLPEHYEPLWVHGFVLQFSCGEHILRELAERSASATAGLMLAAHNDFWTTVDRLWAKLVVRGALVAA